MTSVRLHHVADGVLSALVASAPPTTERITGEHRRALSAHLRGDARVESVVVDAWSIEHAHEGSGPFAWSTRTARRGLAAGALRRIRANGASALSAARAEVDDRLARVATGYDRPGSVGHWLAGLERAALATVIADVAGWASTLVESFDDVDAPWRVAANDAYYEVSGARVTMRGRRDVIVDGPTGPVVIRVRAGSPGRSSGAGLRADLAVDALAHPDGHLATRLIGLWPEAGVVLAVDGDFENVRAGTRDLIRAVNLRRGVRLAA